MLPVNARHAIAHSEKNIARKGLARLVGGAFAHLRAGGRDNEPARQRDYASLGQCASQPASRWTLFGGGTRMQVSAGKHDIWQRAAR